MITATIERNAGVSTPAQQAARMEQNGATYPESVGGQAIMGFDPDIASPCPDLRTSQHRSEQAIRTLPSEVQAAVLSQPDVTLYIGSSDESREAFETLDAAGITCRIVHSARRKEPFVTWGGLDFKGIAGMRDLAGMLRDMDEMLDSGVEHGVPPLAQDENGHLKQWMDDSRRQLSEAAHTIVYQRSAPNGPGHSPSRDNKG